MPDGDVNAGAGRPGARAWDLGKLHDLIGERFPSLFPERAWLSGRVAHTRFEDGRLAFELLDPTAVADGPGPPGPASVHVRLDPESRERVARSLAPDELDQVVTDGQPLVVAGRLEYWPGGRRPLLVMDGIDAEATAAARA